MTVILTPVLKAASNVNTRRKWEDAAEHSKCAASNSDLSRTFIQNCYFNTI